MIDTKNGDYIWSRKVQDYLGSYRSRGVVSVLSHTVTHERLILLLFLCDN